MTSDQPKSRFKRSDVPFWVTIARGLLATFLGLALLIHPDKARPMLVNFMGMFWLASGIMSVRWGASGQPTRQIWHILAGVTGVVAGLLALSRRIMFDRLDDATALNVLGAVMILTGIVHATGGFRVGGRQERHRTWASVLLGIFEIILGILALLAQSLELLPIFYWALTTWALVGGFVLFTDALALRRRAKQKQSVAER